MIRLDRLRAGEQELREAFARGELDQRLREYAAAFVRAELAVPDWLTRIQSPGPARDYACKRLAREWAELETEQSVLAYARGVLSTSGMFTAAEVTPIRPEQRAPSVLAGLLDRLTKSNQQFRSELEAERESRRIKLEELRAQQRALKD